MPEGKKMIGALGQGESFWPEAVASCILKVIHMKAKKLHAA